MSTQLLALEGAYAGTVLIIVLLEAPVVLRRKCVGALSTVMPMSSSTTNVVFCKTLVFMYRGYSTTNTVVNIFCIGDP